MKIFVKVKPKAKKSDVKKLGSDRYQVSVTEAPEKGKANQEVIKLLTKYFKTNSSRVILLKGEKSRVKIFELLKG